jgi:cysteine synthase A
MAENFSIERRKLMRFLGAKVIFTPVVEKGSGMLAKARELAEKHGWFLCHQFENEANADMHSRTTAEEILSDFGANGLDYWVTGAGTGGTLKGVARVLKARSPATRVVVCEPDNSPLLASGFKQPYLEDGSPGASDPGFRPHLMQGWTPDFIPKLANDAITAGLIDQFVPIRGAVRCSARAISRRRRASSAAFPPARPSPGRSKSRRPRKKARRSWRCFPTRASAISRRLSSRALPRR